MKTIIVASSLLINLTLHTFSKDYNLKIEFLKEVKQNKKPKFKKSHNLLIEHVKLSFDLCKRLKFNHFLTFLQGTR